MSRNHQPSSVDCQHHSDWRTLATSFYRANKPLAIAYMLIFLCLAVKDIVYTHYFGKFIGSLKDKEFGAMRKALAIMAVIFVSFALVGVADAYIEARLSTRFDTHTRNSLMSDLLTMQTTNFRELEQGEIMVRVNQLPGMLFYFMMFIRDAIVWKAVVGLFILCYFAWKHPPFALPLVILPIVAVWMVQSTLKVCLPQARERERKLVDIIRYMDDVLRNAMSILNTNKQETEANVIRKMHGSFEKMTYASMQCVIRSQLALTVTILATVIVLAFLMVQRYQQGKIDAGGLVAVILLVSMFIGSVQGISGSMRFMITRWGSIQEAFKVFEVCRWTSNNKDASAPPTAALPAVPSSAVIALRNVYFGYPTKTRMVLTNVSLEFPRKRITMITGPIGTGKSSLLSLMMRYQQPSSGDLYLEGKNYADIPLKELRRRIGYVPQQPLLFNRTIYENVVYGADDNEYDRVKVEALFAKMGLKEIFLDTMPNGLDTPCGKNGSFLSGGQRQMVLLMRVLIQDPEVILLDEPTASVDSITKGHVVKMLKSLLEGRSIIMVTHDPDLVKLADHVVAM